MDSSDVAHGINRHAAGMVTFIVTLVAYRGPTGAGRWCASALSYRYQPMARLNVFAVE